MRNLKIISSELNSKLSKELYRELSLILNDKLRNELKTI